MRESCVPLPKDDHGGDYGAVTMNPIREQRISDYFEI
jgi:hypothetical protein